MKFTNRHFEFRSAAAMHRTVVRASARSFSANQARYASSSSSSSPSPSSTTPYPIPTIKNNHQRQHQFFQQDRAPGAGGKAKKNLIFANRNHARMTEELVRRARAKEGGGWKHARKQKTPTTAAEKLLSDLNATVKSKQEARVSQEREVFDSTELADTDESEETRFTPEAPLGSFVEIRRNEVIEYGVVAGSGFKDRQWQLSVITPSGESWSVLKEDCYFTIPNLCSRDLAIRCGMEAQPANEVQLQARVEVLRRMRRMTTEVENAMVGVSRQLNTVYEAVRARNPKEWSEVTMSEIAQIVHKNPTSVEIYATHKVLMGAPIRFVASASYPVTQLLSVRPREEVEDLTRVIEWVREKNSILDEFADKGLAIAEQQRRIAAESMTEPPTVAPGEHTWTANEMTIIRFLRASLRHGRAVQMDPYTVPLGYILRRLYGIDMLAHGDDYVQQFLVGIGVLAPWSDLVINDRKNKFDLESNPTVLERRESAILRALENSKAPTPVHPEDFYPADPLASIRHDWGDMPAYVIDDFGAEELDDALSVERIPNEPDNYWIHVHIADPAALIPPTNFLAEKAAEQHETWYMVNKSFPLFPNCIVHHPTRGLSLGTLSKNGLPENVLTFSAKVDSKGEFLDYAVRAGLIRNVKLLNYDSINAKLGIVSGWPRYPFGNEPAKPPLLDIDDSIASDLRLLLDYALRQTTKRIDMNWFQFIRTNCEISRASTFPDEADLNNIASRLYRGFPKLTYQITSIGSDSEPGSRYLVAETMKLAAKVASMWFHDRDIPMIRRCSNPMVPSSEEAIQALLEMRNDQGLVAEEGLLKHIIYQPAGYYSTKPAMHWGIGVPDGQGYARVTSPLRRYGDLVAHWQIHRALIQEKRGQKMTGLYDTEWMEKAAIRIAMKEQYSKGTNRRHNRYWALMYIKRWREMFADGKNRDLWPMDKDGNPIEDPLGNLEGYFVTMPKLNRLSKEIQAQVQIPSLGIKEYLSEATLKDLGFPEIGNILPVKVRDIHLGVKPTMTLGVDFSRRSSM
ncbi:hypothetical protein NP233_g11165 [Leucocoprinus birnbaumii]|uniref:RNB domain-containing protein n=1 Tax=Leucocoprinus birnbaumii TaxID=56174 RepID=A0AAD5VJE1_9AGAR|nr:hypothetical protein NP233_g11165 [Leucocoprinus birnbaumii]